MRTRDHVLPSIREQLGQALAEQHRLLPITMRTAVSVSRRKVDVADRGAGVEVAQAITDTHGAPDALFNVAGLIHAGRLVDSDFDHTQRVT